MNLTAEIVKQLLEKVKVKLEGRVQSKLLKFVIDDTFNLVEGELINEIIAELKADGVILP